MKTFIALVTFKRMKRENDALPDYAEGAVGWMAIRCASEDNVEECLDRALRAESLQLKEVDEITWVTDIDDVRDKDDHLATNMKAWAAGRDTAWGTLHLYLGDGEA